MDKLPWIITTVLGVVLAVIIGVLAYFKAKLTKTKGELDTAKSTLDKQKKVVKEYNAEADKATEIQQEAKKKKEALATAIKGVQTSAEPIKQSIDIGNDIVAGFNAD